MHWVHKFPRSISGHSIFAVNSHNRVPTSSFAIATMRRNFVTNFHSASCPPLSLSGTVSTLLSWSQVDALSASYRNSPHSIESTSCHGRHQFLLWQHDCGLRLQADPSQGWSLQSDPTRSSFFWMICRVVLFATRCLSVPVTVWPALPYVEVRDGEQIQHGWDVLLVFCRIIVHKVSTCAVHNSCAPNALGMLCTVISAPRRLSRIVQCSQQP